MSASSQVCWLTLSFRVFRGDERPSMMQRPQVTRSGTLIDAQALHQNAQGDVRRPDLQRSPSSGEPLLNFATDPIPGTNIQARPQIGRAGNNLPTVRSVFGVDQIWEKELAKLQKIEELERVEEEERKKREAEERAREEAKVAKKAAKKAKGKNKPLLDAEIAHDQSTNADHSISPIERAPEAPPLLPTVNPFAMPPKVADSSDSGSDADTPGVKKAPSRMQNNPESHQEWLSDDERPAVARPRPRPRARPRPPTSGGNFAAGLRINNDSDDSDVPLTSALAKAKQRQQAEDSEEDKPLAAVLKNSISTLDFGGTVLEVQKPVQKVSIPQPQLRTPALRDTKVDDDDDEDDKPLALRVSRFGVGGGESDDEKPLGMRYSMAPSQVFVQQQQQQQAMMQQQMMQQQMMAAASIRGSMFNPMMMGNMNMGMGFGNPMGMPGINPGMMAMAGPPMGIIDTPPVDPAKLSAVDRWRRGVGSAAGGDIGG